MKPRKSVLCVVLTFGVLLFLTSCATTKTPLPTDNIDELLGTWVNPEYDKSDALFGKLISREDRTIEWYYSTKSGNPENVQHIIDVKEKWMDRKGAVYFKVFVDGGGFGANMLIRIDSDRKTLEMLSASRMELLPSEMNPDTPYCNYYIWHRQ